MTTLSEWASRWQLHPQALQELQAIMGVMPEATTVVGKSEAAAQQLIRLESSRRQEPLWRNNVGVASNAEGVPVRYGLANDSKAVNKIIKSSDLIGITPYTIKPNDVNNTIGIFTSYEVKKPGWMYKGTPREVAQLAWIQLVISLGGKAQFATGTGDIWHD